MQSSYLECGDKLSRLISDGAVFGRFQPIVSVKTRSVIGYEGLCRGLCPSNSSVVSPVEMFEKARAHKMVTELDRLCRRTILSEASGVLRDNPSLLFFVNIDVSLIDHEDTISCYTDKLVRDLGIQPHNIVIEICESKVENTAKLKTFVEIYKERGFLIALDDVGSGHGNFDRIPLTRPDVLKIDRSIVTGISDDYFRQEVFRSIVNLCRKIGALVLAEGVETEEDTLKCLELGADLMQGFYFGRPEVLSDYINSSVCAMQVSLVADMYRRLVQNNLRALRSRYSLYNEVIGMLKGMLSQTEAACFSPVLEKHVEEHYFIEALYVIDMQGVQVSETVLNCNIPKKKVSIFQPARLGDDHTMKEYYYTFLNTGIERYTTDTYLSFATGNLCRTISVLFESCDEKYILCMDVMEDT